MATIKLRGTAGLEAAVDGCDADLGLSHRWYALHPRGSRTTYARTGWSTTTLFMHRAIMLRVGPIPTGYEIGHIDGDGLNNRRANLRLVTRSENIKAAHDRLAFDRSGLPEPEHVHTVKRVLATGEVREYRYDRRTRKRLPDPPNCG